MNLLSETDAAVLNAARAILRDLERAAFQANADPDTGTRERDLGRFAEACGLASEGAFNVLNTANAYLRDERAGAAMSPPGPPETDAALETLRAALTARGLEAVPE